MIRSVMAESNIGNEEKRNIPSFGSTHSNIKGEDVSAGVDYMIVGESLQVEGGTWSEGSRITAGEGLQIILSVFHQ